MGSKSTLSACLNILFTKLSYGKLCIAYAILSFGTSALSSIMEGSFISPVPWMVNEQEIRPFIKNFSTILDFLVLNPLVIYFLESASRKAEEVYEYKKVKPPLSQYHHFGLLIICSAIASVLMNLYYEGFLNGNFIDAVISINSGGNKFITTTGLIVYFWTTFFIAFLLFKVIQITAYVYFILRLKHDDWAYEPYHTDEAAGYGLLAEPMIKFSYAMIGMLLMFIVFILYDLKLEVKESNRIYGFFLYVFIVIPIFCLPYWKLHQFMVLNRKKYLKDISDIASSVADKQYLDTDLKDNSKLKEYCENIESISKLREIALSFPIWPIPVKSAISLQLITAILALAPLLTKTIPGLISI